MRLMCPCFRGGRRHHHLLAAVREDYWLCEGKMLFSSIHCQISSPDHFILCESWWCGYRWRRDTAAKDKHRLVCVCVVMGGRHSRRPVPWERSRTRQRKIDKDTQEHWFRPEGCRLVIKPQTDTMIKATQRIEVDTPLLKIRIIKAFKGEWWQTDSRKHDLLE